MSRKEGGEQLKVGERLITIKGIVIPVDWDKEGKVVAAAISTHDEDEYLIDNNHKGRELLDLLQEEVQVTGIMREVDGKKAITAKMYMKHVNSSRLCDYPLEQI